MQWSHDWYHQHHIMPVLMTSYDHKSHVTASVDCLHLTNKMVTLVSQDVNTSANGITWPKKSCCTLFNCLDLAYAVVPLTMLQASDAASTYGIIWPKSYVKPCFYLLNLINKTVLLLPLVVSCDADAGANAVIWPVTNKFVPHFHHLVITNAMVLLMTPLALHGTNQCQHQQPCCTSL